MFLLGLLSIFQIVLFPGLVFAKLYRIQGGFFFRLSSIFASSLILNFLVVYFLTLLKIYIRPVYLGLIAFEIVALIWMYRHELLHSLDHLSEKVSGYVRGVLQQLKEMFSTPGLSAGLQLLRQVILAILMGIAVSLLVWFIRRLTNNIGTVFNTWDAVVSWNNWAQIYATNQIPDFYSYPHLFPANLSITYLLLGNTEVVLFAKSIMPLFSIMIVLTLFELAFEQKKAGYFIAIILCYLMFKKFTGDILTDGYADLPVTFMVFVSFVQILKHSDLVLQKKELILGGIFAAGAALTKQVGVYCCIVYPLVAFLSTSGRNREKFKNILMAVVISALITFTWYLPKLINMTTNFSSSALPLLTGMASHSYDDVSTVQRIFLAFTGLGKYAFVYLASIPFIFLMEKRLRLLIVFFLLPFTLLWTIIASYDTRNLAITIPIVAVIIGLGCEKLLDLGFVLLSKIKVSRVPSAILFGLLVVILVGMSFWLTNEKIITRQNEKQRLIFSPDINELVYSLPFEDDGCSRVLTNYPVSFLPGLKENQVDYWFSDIESYHSIIQDPSICWVLFPNYANEQIKMEIEEKVTNSQYTLLFKSLDWVPYELVRIR